MKIKDICVGVTDGSHNPPQGIETSNYYMLSSKNVFDNEITFDDPRYLTESDFEQENKRTKIGVGDVLLTIVGTVGRTAVVDEAMPCFTLQRSVAVLHPKAEICNSKYLMYALQGKRSYIESHAKGVAQKGIYLKEVSDIDLNVPSLSEQEDIVVVLDKVASIIHARRQELQKLDELIKARFVEMFGDPIHNTQNRPTTEFINVVKMQRGFDLPVQDRQQDGNIPVYGSNGALDHHNVAKITGGGVITGRSGTIGKVFYTESDYWPLNTSLFSVDTHGNNVIYLAKLLELYDLSRFVEGTGVPTLNRNMFHNKQIVDVGIDEQNRFADFVKQVDKSKVVVQKALDEAQLLFDSLMQKYFG